MKRGTITHPKTLELAAALTLARYAAVGLLESLWHWTATYAYRGDVGRFSNRAIADGVGWDRDADELIDALLKCGWLDAHETCRLVIHDWCDHADDAVRKRLEYNNLQFAVVKKRLKPQGKSKSRKSRENVERNSGDSPACQSQSQSQSQSQKPVPEPLPLPSPSPSPLPEAGGQNPHPPPEAAGRVGVDYSQTRILEQFKARWEDRYGSPYTVTSNACKHALQIAKAIGDPDEAVAIVDAYFDLLDEKLEAENYPIGYLIHRLPKLRLEVAQERETPAEKNA